MTRHHICPQGLESQLASVELTKTELEQSLAESRTALENLREEHGTLQSSVSECVIFK